MTNENNYVSLGLSSVSLVKDVILRPGDAFRKTKNGELQRETLIVFAVAALIPLLKSFSARRQSINFFADERLNQLLSILSIPQIKWFIMYFVYFAMIYFIFGICRLFGRTESLKDLMMAFMSISAVGVVSQILFLAIHFVLPKNVMFTVSYLVYLWVIGLSIRAIQVTQDLSFSKALVSFLPPAIILAVICGMTIVAPYLTWLSA